MPLIDRIVNAWNAARNAVELLLEEAAHLNPWLLAAGVVLHFAAQAVRQRGWFNILRSAYPKAGELRLRDVEAAYFAGAGLNGVLPARGGDVVKLYLLHRRIERSRYTTLAGTLVPETLFETLCGIALVVWALTQGFLPVPTSPSELPSLDVSFLLAHPILSTLILAGATAAGILLGRRLRERARVAWARLKQGMTILRRPRDFVTGVAAWQALGRLVRLGSIACFMAAFALPVTVGTVLLVMAAQGGTRIIPIAPASSGLRLIMLSYGLVEITGQPVDIAAVTAFSFGVGAALLVTGLAVSVAILLATLGTASPRRALAAARAALPGAGAARPRRRRVRRA